MTIMIMMVMMSFALSSALGPSLSDDDVDNSDDLAQSNETKLDKGASPPLLEFLVD